MLILNEAACFDWISITQLFDMPFTWPEILEKRKCFLKELHIYLLKVRSRSLRNSFLLNLRIKFKRFYETTSNSLGKPIPTIRIASNAIGINRQYAIFQQPPMIVTAGLTNYRIHFPKPL